MKIRNIIFDLGGVLIDLDFTLTKNAFTKLGVKDFDQYFTQVHSNPLFKMLETGAVTDKAFYEAVRNSASIKASDAEIDDAWNAMLLNFHEQKIEKLKELGVDYRLFLFSNTNAIHHQSFQQKFLDVFGFELDSIFEKAYYSHLIGYRKPDVSSFTFILKDSGLQANETLFIDDTLPNIEAAREAGLQTLYLQPGQSLIEQLELCL